MQPTPKLKPFLSGPSDYQPSCIISLDRIKLLHNLTERVHLSFLEGVVCLPAAANIMSVFVSDVSASLQPVDNHDGGPYPRKTKRGDKQGSGLHTVRNSVPIYSDRMWNLSWLTHPWRESYSRTSKRVVLCFRSPLAYPDPSSYQVNALSFLLYSWYMFGRLVINWFWWFFSLTVKEVTLEISSLSYF